MSAGSVADHDALTEAFDRIDLSRDGRGVLDVPLGVIEHLSHLAYRCGWTGEDHLLDWTRQRIETYRKTITNKGER